MALRDELHAEVKQIFEQPWTTRNGQKVPETEDIGLGNDAVKLTGTVLYADISDSTKLVDGHSPEFAAEIYKAFLRCAAKVVRHLGGSITAYDGDRIMAIFIGDAKNSTAAKAGLMIHGTVDDVIKPAQKKQYPNRTYELKHTVGIDTSDLFVVRGGVRGDSDLIWLGRAGNHAAKMCALSDNYQTTISEDVYKMLNTESKFSNGKDMWVRSYMESPARVIYRSAYLWHP